MAVSRFRPPTRRSLIIEALKADVNTAGKIAELLGVERHTIQSELTDMAARGQIKRAGTVKEARRGPPLQLWAAR